MTFYDQAIGCKLGNRYSYPDATPREWNGAMWSRTHRMRCPVCQNEFYGWQPEDRPFEPYRNPAGLRGTDGGRQTCGHPVCEKTERRNPGRTADYPVLLGKAENGGDPFIRL
nr:hypothetical protein [uncultured Holophaga sp.]